MNNTNHQQDKSCNTLMYLSILILCTFYLLSGVSLKASISQPAMVLLYSVTISDMILCSIIKFKFGDKKSAFYIMSLSFLVNYIVGLFVFPMICYYSYILPIMLVVVLYLDSRYIIFITAVAETANIVNIIVKTSSQLVANSAEAGYVLFMIVIIGLIFWRATNLLKRFMQERETAIIEGGQSVRKRLTV